MCGYRSIDVDRKDALTNMSGLTQHLEGRKTFENNTETVNAVHMNLRIYILNFIQKKRKITHISLSITQSFN